MSCGAKLRNSKCYILNTADAMELKTCNKIYIKDVRYLEILDFRILMSSCESQEYFQFSSVGARHPRVLAPLALEKYPAAYFPSQDGLLENLLTALICNCESFNASLLYTGRVKG